MCAGKYTQITKYDFEICLKELNKATKISFKTQIIGEENEAWREVWLITVEKAQWLEWLHLSGKNQEADEQA